MTAPVSLPALCAPPLLWPRIALMFRHRADTLLIAQKLGLSEAQVYNALHKMREQARAA